MSNVVSGWKRGAVFTASEKVFIPRISTDQSEHTEEIISSEATDTVMYGGKIHNVAIGFFEASIIAKLEEWQNESEPVSIAVASRGQNILTGKIQDEPIRVIRGDGVNARNGLVVNRVEFTALDPNERVYVATNLAVLEQTTISGAGSFEIAFPISGITYGASALLTGDLTLTIKDQAGVTLATATATASGGFAELTLDAPAGAWSVELSTTAGATEVTLRTDGLTAFINH